MVVHVLNLAELTFGFGHINNDSLNSNGVPVLICHPAVCFVHPLVLPGCGDDLVFILERYF